MAIKLKEYAYIEANNLKGLQPGFVIAQEDRVAGDLLTEDGMFVNGKLCFFTEDGIVKATAATEETKYLKPVFIHYTEPLNTVYNSDKYFAIEVNEDGKAVGECPRLVQLIPGDEWMSTEDLGDNILGGRIIKVSASEGWYSVATMANGETGYHYVFLG